MTPGFDVLVQEVIAAMTKSPLRSSPDGPLVLATGTLASSAPFLNSATSAAFFPRRRPWGGYWNRRHMFPRTARISSANPRALWAASALTETAGCWPDRD